MLGLGRASQYAGWWNGGIKYINFAGSSAMVPLTEQTPEFSILTDSGAPGRTLISPATGSYNITGLTGFTGYNNNRMTMVSSYYLPWSAGMANNTYGNPIAFWLNDNSSVQWGSSNIYISIVGGSLQMGGQIYGVVNLNSITLPGAYTTYTNQWLTTVISVAETSTAFTNWSAGTTSTQGMFIRVATYNTQTGQLIAKQDTAASGTAALPNLSTLASTLTTLVPFSITVSNNLWAYSNSDNTYPWRVGGVWFSLGTMFDPLTVTDTSWRTPSPAAVIGTGRAWSNWQLTNSTTLPAAAGSYINTSGQDLYSEPSNAATSTMSAANWTTAYSNTTIIRNN